MELLVRLLIAVLVGIIAYFLAHLVLNDAWSTLIGWICGILYFVGHTRL